MSLTDNDLQSVSLDETPPHGMPPVDVEAVEGGGPGCFLWGVVGVLGLGFAIVIVALSGAAGWTSGQRQAQSRHDAGAAREHEPHRQERQRDLGERDGADQPQHEQDEQRRSRALEPAPAGRDAVCG